MLSTKQIENYVKTALKEDTCAGENFHKHDLTVQAFIPPDAVTQLSIVSRDTCIISGMQFARTAFTLCDATIKFKTPFCDSTKVEAGQILATVTGNSQAILTAERTALNFLQHLSAIATITHQYQQAISHTNTRILDTRKTTPGLRLAEKYAVTCGGGINHRLGLYDAIMIKDNHAAICNTSFEDLMEKALQYQRAGKWVIVECDELYQFKMANDLGIQHILLDNMPLEILSKAVGKKAPRVKLEASGNIDLSTVKAVAETGVDYISTSKITRNAQPVDIGLDYNYKA